MSDNTIDKQIGTISDYFLSMERMKGLNVIKVLFPEKWKCFPNDSGTIKTDRDRQQPYVWWVYGSTPEIQFDEIKAHTEFVIQFNVELDDKKRLFSEKADELKRLFTTLDLKTLQTLIFKYKEPKKRVATEEKKKKSGSTTITPTTEEVPTPKKEG